MRHENACKCSQNLRGEVAVKVQGTADSGELGEAVNDHEGGVVGKLETTTDSGELGEAGADKVLAADERQGATNRGEVGGGEVGKVVGVEAARAVERGERGEAGGGDVAHGDVVGPDEVGEAGRDVVAVGLDDERRGDVAELHVDLLEVVVVGNSHAVDRLEVDTIEAVQLRVLNGHGARLLNTGGEGETLQGGQGAPVNRLHTLEAGEVESGEEGETGEGEGVVNDGEAVTRELGDLADIVGRQASLYSGDAVEGDLVGGASGDGDAAGEGGAGGQGRGISGALKGGGGRNAALGCEWSSSVTALQMHVRIRWCFGLRFRAFPLVCPKLTHCAASNGQSRRDISHDGHFDVFCESSFAGDGLCARRQVSQC